MIKRNFTACLAVLGLGASVACSPAAIAESAAMQVDVPGWDTNADGSLDHPEFCTGLPDSPIFGNWDVNEDDRLSRDEYTTNVNDAIGQLDERLGENAFDTWDADGDGFVTRQEFCYGIFDTYDADQSGSLEDSETGTLSDDLEDEDLLGSAVIRADTGLETRNDDANLGTDTGQNRYGSAIAAVTGWAAVDLDAIASASEVSIVPLSTLQGGSEEDIATLETALAAHAMAKADVHAAAESNSAISTKLEQEGFAIDNVVAIRPANGTAVTVYVDDRA